MSKKQSKSLTNYICPHCEEQQRRVQDSEGLAEKPGLGAGTRSTKQSRVARQGAPEKKKKANNTPAKKTATRRVEPARQNPQSRPQDLHLQQDDLPLQQYLYFCESVYRERPTKQRTMEAYVRKFWNGLNNDEKRYRGITIQEMVKNQLDEHGWTWPIFHKTIWTLVDNFECEIQEKPGIVGDDYMEDHQYPSYYLNPNRKTLPQVEDKQKKARQPRRAIPLVWEDDEDIRSSE